AGNLKTGDNTTVVTFARTSGTGSVTGLGTATATGGVATKTVSGALAGPLRSEERRVGLNADTATFSIVPGSADHLTFTSSTAHLAAGNTRTLTVEVRDAAGNLETADNSTNVSFARRGGTGSVSGLGTATAAGGVATKTVTGALAGPL